MAAKQIQTVTEQGDRADRSTILLRGGTYDTDTGIINPGSERWLAPVHTDDRAYTLELAFDDGTTASVELTELKLTASSVTVVVHPSR
ncbi:MAG: hypothetical protein K0V04_36080 [Deltaproteobacteria bacterium]|nr:hypothetical protein [Deltaproteobacteria bacterium]